MAALCWGRRRTRCEMRKAVAILGIAFLAILLALAPPVAHACIIGGGFSC